jgi:hypothetical protein
MLRDRTGQLRVQRGRVSAMNVRARDAQCRLRGLCGTVRGELRSLRDTRGAVRGSDGLLRDLDEAVRGASGQVAGARCAVGGPDCKVRSTHRHGGFYSEWRCAAR